LPAASTRSNYLFLLFSIPFFTTICLHSVLHLSILADELYTLYTLSGRVLELGGNAVELESTFIMHVHLAMHETVLGLPEGQVLVVSITEHTARIKRLT